MALSKNEMGGSHPDLNALAAFIDLRLSEAERAAVITHLAGCVECRALVAAHARGVRPVPVHADHPSAGRSRWGLRPAGWLPVAATLALATTAALVLWRIDPGAPAPAGRVPIASEPARPATGTTVPATGTTVPATETPVPVAPDAHDPVRRPPPAPTLTVPPGQHEDPLATRRNAARVVNGKSFRLVAGEWIDAAYDPAALLPVRDLVGPEARTDAVTRIPALAQYTALGANVTIVHDGVVYRFRR